MYVVLLLVINAVFTMAVMPVRVSGASMMTSLHDGDLALMSRLNIDDIKRFDVVVIDSSVLQEKIIKRVIGLPGETIEYRADVLYVNGVATEETFIDREAAKTMMAEEGATLFTADFTYTVPQGTYFVLGDNRLHSTDSRTLGAISPDNIKARTGFILYPFSRTGEME